MPSSMLLVVAEPLVRLAALTRLTSGAAGIDSKKVKGATESPTTAMNMSAKL